MFAPRQLLGLSTLMQGIMAEEDQTLKEMLLTAFYAMLNNNNVFARYQVFSYREGKVQGIFSRHDFQPKVDFGECNVWGLEDGHGSFATCFGRVAEGKAFAKNPYDWHANTKRYNDPLAGRPEISSKSSTVGNYLSLAKAVITDPPYVGNVNYAELADFFYVWLRLALKDSYSHFAPEYTPKLEEIVENSVRKKSKTDFFSDLAAVFQRISEHLPAEGLLAFTFHHTDQEGKVWEGLLEALCETGFEVLAVYPIHAESETSLHLMNKENISYDSSTCVGNGRMILDLARGQEFVKRCVAKRAKSYRRLSEEGMVINRCLNPMCDSFVSESAWSFTARTTARCWIMKTNRFRFTKRCKISLQLWINW
jgi:putative DNA methylase